MQGPRPSLVGLVARWGAGSPGARVRGASGVPRPACPPSPPRRAVTLQFWSRFATPIQDVEEKNLPVFMERSAPIKVERTLAAVDYGQLVEKITTAFASAEATTTVPARKSAEKAPYLQNPLLR